MGYYKNQAIEQADAELEFAEYCDDSQWYADMDAEIELEKQAEMESYRQNGYGL